MRIHITHQKLIYLLCSMFCLLCFIAGTHWNMLALWSHGDWKLDKNCVRWMFSFFSVDIFVVLCILFNICRNKVVIPCLRVLDTIIRRIQDYKSDTSICCCFHDLTLYTSSLFHSRGLYRSMAATFPLDMWWLIPIGLHMNHLCSMNSFPFQFLLGF